MQNDFHPIFPPSSLPHINCVHAVKEKELGGINKWDTPLRGCEVCPSIMETLPLEGWKDLPLSSEHGRQAKVWLPHNPAWRTSELVRLYQHGSGVAHRRAANPNAAAPQNKRHPQNIQNVLPSTFPADAQFGLLSSGLPQSINSSTCGDPKTTRTYNRIT